MRCIDAHPGSTIRMEEGEWYFVASATIDGVACSIRVPLGDGRYLAQIVTERIILSAIARRPLDYADTEVEAPVELDEQH